MSCVQEWWPNAAWMWASVRSSGFISWWLWKVWWSPYPWSSRAGWAKQPNQSEASHVQWVYLYSVTDWKTEPAVMFSVFVCCSLRRIRRIFSPWRRAQNRPCRLRSGSVGLTEVTSSSLCVLKINEHDLNSFPLPLKLKHIELDCPAFNVENSFMNSLKELFSNLARKGLEFVSC